MLLEIFMNRRGQVFNRKREFPFFNFHNETFLISKRFNAINRFIIELVI